MTYARLLRDRYPGLDPRVDDFYLFEAHQIAALPDRAPPRQLAAVLHSRPELHRFFVAREPEIESFLAGLVAAHPPVGPGEQAECEAALSWELADWILYQRDPGRYDDSSEFDVGLSAITDSVGLAGKVVVDAGAGTGQLAFAVCPLARHVFAVEPVASCRRFIRERAAQRALTNVFVLDGFLHAIPLPAASADVLLTRQAIGWDLAAELAEIERIVAPGGTALHLVGTPYPAAPDDELHRSLVAAGYEPGAYREHDVAKARYRRRFDG